MELPSSGCDQAALLRLPPEIRNKIYELVLLQADAIKIKDPLCDEVEVPEPPGPGYPRPDVAAYLTNEMKSPWARMCMDDSGSIDQNIRRMCSIDFDKYPSLINLDEIDLRLAVQAYRRKVHEWRHELKKHESAKETASRNAEQNVEILSVRQVPALLQTCHLLRSEGLGMYLECNTFIFPHIKAYNAKTLWKRDIALNYDRKSIIMYLQTTVYTYELSKEEASTSSKNLLEWVQAYAQDESCRVRIPFAFVDTTMRRHVSAVQALYGIFKTARALHKHGVPWDWIGAKTQRDFLAADVLRIHGQVLLRAP